MPGPRGWDLVRFAILLSRSSDVRWVSHHMVSARMCVYEHMVCVCVCSLALPSLCIVNATHLIIQRCMHKLHICMVTAWGMRNRSAHSTCTNVLTHVNVTSRVGREGEGELMARDPTHIYIYIYIYRERERESEREQYIYIYIHICIYLSLSLSLYIYIYIYTYVYITYL